MSETSIRPRKCDGHQEILTPSVFGKDREYHTAQVGPVCDRSALYTDTSPRERLRGESGPRNSQALRARNEIIGHSLSCLIGSHGLKTRSIPENMSFGVLSCSKRTHVWDLLLVDLPRTQRPLTSIVPQSSFLFLPHTRRSLP